MDHDKASSVFEESEKLNFEISFESDVEISKSNGNREESVKRNNEMSSETDVEFSKTNENPEESEKMNDEIDIDISKANENQSSDEDARVDFMESSVDITPDKSGGVLKKILREGEGEEYPGHGDKVSVHYTGWRLGKEPVEFDSSRKGDKFEFNLGRGMVIKGWDLGISTMRRGEVALFICHPRYAYGDMGYPPAIPPFTPLLFEIELFDWKLEDLSSKRDGSILRKVLDKGEGSMFPNEGSRVKVKMVRYGNDDETVEVEMEFVLGEGCVCNVTEGIELALSKFHLKEKSVIYLRQEDSSSQEKYEVTLTEFEKAKDVWEMNSDEKLEKARLLKEKGVEFFKLGHTKVALRQFRGIVACLENEPGASPETRECRKCLLLSAYLNIALCHQKLGNHLDAIRVCDRALALDPQNEKALFRRGQAKVEINDCEEALADFQNLCTLKPENRAAQRYVSVCHTKIKQQHNRDKSTYNKMFELFVKQDQERLKNMKTETGVWEGDSQEDDQAVRLSSTRESLFSQSNSALLDANVIELSNTANGKISYSM